MSEVDSPRKVRPLKGKIYVRRDREREELARGGTGLIQLLSDYRARKSPRLTFDAKPDFWPAEVLAVGELPVGVDVRPGDCLLVYTFRDNPGSTKREGGMYSGSPVGRDRYFIDPDDIVCAVDWEDE